MSSAPWRSGAALHLPPCPAPALGPGAKNSGVSSAGPGQRHRPRTARLPCTYPAAPILHPHLPTCAPPAPGLCPAVGTDRIQRPGMLVRGWSTRAKDGADEGGAPGGDKYSQDRLAGAAGRERGALPGRGGGAGGTAVPQRGAGTAAPGPDPDPGRPVPALPCPAMLWPAQPTPSANQTPGPGVTLAPRHWKLRPTCQAPPPWGASHLWAGPSQSGLSGAGPKHLPALRPMMSRD